MVNGKLQSTDTLLANDYRRSLPRLQDDAIASNRMLVAELERLAARRGVTAAQLSLAWLLA